MLPALWDRALEGFVGPCHSLTKSTAVSGLWDCALEGFVEPCHSLAKPNKEHCCFWLVRLCS